MAVKDSYHVAQSLENISLGLNALSLVYLVVSIQTLKFGDKSNPLLRKGVFPFTWLFVLCFVFEAFVRGGSLFSEGNTTSHVFQTLKPYFDKTKDGGINIPDLLFFAWKTLGSEDYGTRFVLRVSSVAMAAFLVVNRLSLGSGSDSVERNLKYMMKTAVTVTAFAALTGLAARSCGDLFFVRSPEILSSLKPNVESVIKFSEYSQVCLYGPVGVGEALITIALLHASISWNKSSWIGLQHVLAYRWASVMVHMYALHLKGLLLDEVAKPRFGIESQTQALATMVQVVFVFGLFVPKFAIRQPLAFLAILAIISGAAAVTLGSVPMPLDFMYQLQPVLGQWFVFLVAVAIVLSGGIGISFAMFAVATSASIQAPWFRTMLVGEAAK